MEVFRLGKYELLLPLASGGMATVYLARISGVGGFSRHFAVKVMHPHLRFESDWKAEFIEEAKLTARIHHPNVVPVLDVGDDPQGTFLVMEYIEGAPISVLMRKAATVSTTVPLPIAMRLLTDALAGLHAAHELVDDQERPLGLVHRDFSPQNVIAGVDGVAWLTDFGIAKAASRLAMTATGFIKGKTAYMSPEQIRGEAKLDRRSDVWAAGVVAWELFAGRRLYPRMDDVALALKIVTEEPPRLRSVCSKLPERLDEAVARALCRDIKLRTDSADSFRRELLAISQELPEPVEVGAYVRAALGDELSGRRERLEQVQRERQEASRVTPRPTIQPAKRRNASAKSGARKVGALAVAGMGIVGGAWAFRTPPKVNAAHVATNVAEAPSQGEPPRSASMATPPAAMPTAPTDVAPAASGKHPTAAPTLRAKKAPPTKASSSSPPTLARSPYEQ